VSGWLSRAELDDGALDALAMVECLTAGDEEGLGALFHAQDGHNAAPLVVSLLGLIDRLLSETGTDAGEWAARARQRITG